MMLKWACLLGVTLPALVLGLGGPVRVDPKELDPKIRDFALSQLEAGSNNLLARKVVKVTDVNVQTVSGKLYTFTLELAFTECAKVKGQDLDQCDVKQDTVTEKCTLKVWSRPWLSQDKLQLTEIAPCTRTTNEAPEDQGRGFVPGQVQILNDLDDADDDLDDESENVDDFLDLIQTEQEGQNDPHEVTKKVISEEESQGQMEAKMAQILSNSQSQAALKELQSHSNFKSFVKKFKREYKSAGEYKRRYAIFRENMKKIQFLRETERGTGRYGVTHFSDYSEVEFRQHALGLKPELASEVGLEESDHDFEDDFEIPAKFDWREHGAVTPVKNQGNCGSCWAFSVTGNVEGQWQINRGKLVSLSEQELVDCDRLDSGCNGGLPSNAYQAIMKLGGLETEQAYHYDGRDERCHFNRSLVRVTIDSAVTLPTDEDKMAEFLVKKGPISIGINANAMQFYFGGVSHPWSFLCSKSGIDHGVLIVGLGMDDFPLFHEKLPFWTIKNSWGPGWGEQGYYRVFRGDGTCGVNQMATSAIVKQ